MRSHHRISRQDNPGRARQDVGLSLIHMSGQLFLEVYNDTTGMQLAAFLLCPVADAYWPEPGWKPKSEGFRETKRYFMNWALSIVFESARQASFTGFTFKDPSNVKRKAVPFIFVISKDLGKASAISSVRSSACDSCLVPNEDLPSLKMLLQTAFPDGGRMTCGWSCKKCTTIARTVLPRFASWSW
jgi:hypothetical protein